MFSREITLPLKEGLFHFPGGSKDLITDKPRMADCGKLKIDRKIISGRISPSGPAFNTQLAVIVPLFMGKSDNSSIMGLRSMVAGLFPDFSAGQEVEDKKAFTLSLSNWVRPNST